MDKTFHKGLVLLETLVRSDRPRSITDLAIELGLNKSNVHRILATLASLGYVSQNPELKTYEATLRLWELGSCVVNRLSLKSVALPFMRQLAERTRETVHLSILEGLDVLYVDKIDSPEPIRAYSIVGGRAPAYCVATGKAILAFATDEELANLPFSSFKKYTERTIIKKDAFLKEIQRIRKKGYSVNLGEWRATVRGVAAPIFGVGNAPAAAIGLSGPTERLTENRIRQFAPLVLEAGEAMSRNFGYTADSYPPSFVNTN